jgi:hypothetical protein
MLRVFIFIECDLCNDVMSQIAVAADPREQDSEADDFTDLLHQIRLTAEEHGWEALNDSTVHHCSSCMHS